MADKPLTVLEIIGTATQGGMENQIFNLLKHLPSKYFNIICICPCESRFTTALKELGVEAVYVTPLADDPEWRSIQLSLEVARLHHVDILHAHMPKSHVLAGLAGSLLHKPVLATIHGMHITPHELSVALAVKSHLITNCQETYIQALSMGVPSERVNLFHNGVDTNAFTPGRSDNKLRQRLKVPIDTLLVGYVGRLEYEKGPDLFIRAATLVHEKMPNVHFVVAGSGSMLPHLKEMAEKSQLQNNIYFTDWATKPEEVYNALNILAHTSRSDGTSLVLLEAMACGVPVVAMAVGGVREMIENEYTGMLVASNDFQQLATQIESLLIQPERLHEMGKRARKRVEIHFDVIKNAHQTARLLNTIANSWLNKIDTHNLPISFANKT